MKKIFKPYYSHKTTPKKKEDANYYISGWEYSIFNGIQFKLICKFSSILIRISVRCFIKLRLTIYFTWRSQCTELAKIFEKINFCINKTTLIISKNIDK